MTTRIDRAEKQIAMGKEIYETRIRHLVEPQENGKYLVLDITTGDYAIHAFSLGLATEQLLAKQPDAVLHSVRIGHKAVARIRSPRIIMRPDDDYRKD